ncbi:iron-containing alcohol dehydrogenase [Ilumatobacter nonamiensis]|uniref:iron-containing alcohol dehydrogenase n=1 Tax=Ilumatobacter nonamiensis TaxID=467093 RepID=UPI00034ABA62|nr:iron-containing alcohol dehydrogenase [Ilumatobacter nonamiensis]
MNPRSFEFLRLDRTHIATPLCDAVLTEADLRGADRVAVVASGTLSRSTSVIDDLEAALGARGVGRFDSVEAHAPRSSVFEVVEFLRATDADLVVTVGGGSPLDTVKTALVALAEGLTESDQLEAFAITTGPDGERITPAVGSPPLRQIAAPTTLTGADFSDLAGCVDEPTQRKQLFSGAEIGPAAIILDPAITVYTPMDLWLSSGIRALDHAVETLCSSAPEPLADAGALHAIRLLSRGLPSTKADPDDLEARLECQQAVGLACAGLNRVPYGASHGLGHQLGAVFGMSHGHTSCVMMPHVMAHNEPATGEAQRLIATAMGRPDDPAGVAVGELIAALGLPTRLRDAGATEDQLRTVAEGSIAHPWITGNAVPITSTDELLGLLEQAF